MRLSLALFLVASTALAQAADILRVPAAKLTALPVIDGKLGPDEWAGASRLTNFWDPVSGKPAAEQTEVWLGYDDEAIYIAYKCFDSQPDQIVAREVTPGADMDGEDGVNFEINPFGTRGWDGRSEFAMNALGTQTDNIAGGRAAKKEWRGDWQSATQRLADGWSGEMRIPWKILNFPAGRPLNMDIEVERYQSRTKVMSRWSQGGQQKRPELFGIWEGVNPPKADARRKVEYLAYAAPEFEDDAFRLRMGLDVRSSLTSTLTGLLSLSPDFRNIESQVSGIGFTRTERYLDESRPFFNEGSGFFDLSGPYIFGRMFYSRRIDNFDLGAKAFGQVDPSLGVGALVTHGFDANTTDAVFRVGKTFGPKANVSFYGTHRDHDGVSNSAYGGNAWAKSGSFWTEANLAFENGDGAGTDGAGAVGIAYEVPKIFSVWRYLWVDPKFEPALGYIPWRDRRGVTMYSQYDSEYRTGPLTGIHVESSFDNFQTYDGWEQEKGLGGYIATALRKPEIAFGAGYSENRFSGEIERVVNMDATINYNNRFKRLGFFYQTGTRGGEDTTYGSIGGSYRAFRKVDLGLELARLDYQGTSDQMIATMGYEISPTRSVTGRLVDRNGDINAYLAYRHAGMKGMELFVIVGDPNATTTQRRVSIKAVWAF